MFTHALFFIFLVMRLQRKLGKRHTVYVLHIKSTGGDPILVQRGESRCLEINWFNTDVSGLQQLLEGSY